MTNLSVSEQSERDLAIQRVANRKQKNKIIRESKTILRIAESRKAINSAIAESIPGPKSFIMQNMEEALKRVESGQSNAVARDASIGFTSDENGREYCDLEVSKADLLKSADEEALLYHNNNPNTRLDLCGFPKDRRDRHFLLNYDFGDQLKRLIEGVRHSWVYLYGDPGQGKTSLATRAVWELIKNHPSQKATFISINQWTASLMPGSDSTLDLSKIQKVVLVDDFDKFDTRKDFQIRHVLRLIERLKDRHQVIITSNYSRSEMLNQNPDHLDFKVMLDRIKGKAIDFPRFSGKSHR